MANPILSKRSADKVSLGVLFIGLGALMYTGYWWPTILLVIGGFMATRQYLRGRIYDTMISIFVFGGLYLFYFTPVDWAMIMPVLFITGGIYLIFREFLTTRHRIGSEETENIREEIEDDARKD